MVIPLGPITPTIYCPVCITLSTQGSTTTSNGKEKVAAEEPLGKWWWGEPQMNTYPGDAHTLVAMGKFSQ